MDSDQRQENGRGTERCLFCFSAITRGVAYLDTNDYDKAISDYNEAIRLEPNNGAAYNRGTAYYETEKYDNCRCKSSLGADLLANGHV